MNKTDHCMLCMHREFEIKEGTFCGLTKLKPAFEDACPTFEPSSDLGNQINSMNIEVHEMKKKRLSAIFESSLILFISLAFLIGGFMFYDYTSDHIKINRLSIGLVFIGFLSLIQSRIPYNNWATKMDIAFKDKKRLDETIAMYGMDYEVNIEVQNECHGTIEYNTNLKMKRKAAYEKAINSQTQYMK